MTDDFKTLTLRLSKADRSVTFDGFANLRLGDSLKVIIDGCNGVTPAQVALYLMEKTAGQSLDDALLGVTGFAFTDSTVSRIYATVTLDTALLIAALASSALGTPKELRLIVLEGSMPIVDCDVDVYPNPGVDAGTPDPANPFIRGSDFAGVSAIVSMPTANPAQREARINALLAYLLNLST